MPIQLLLSPPALTRWLPVLAALMLMLTVAVPGAAAIEPDYLVIAHESVGHKVISAPELKRIFTKKRSHWDNGQPIVIVEQGGDSHARDTFYRKILKSDIAQMSTYWINQTMTNGLAPPKIYSNARRVVSYVARTPGAIAFIDANANVVLSDGVKRITVR